MLPKPQQLSAIARLKTFTLSLAPLAAIGRLAAVCLLALLLSGCVNYDVGVKFKNQHSGEIVQVVKLGDRLAAINGASAQQWLDSLEQRARQLQGKTQRLSPQELQVRIPFTTDKDFVQKFNRFFAGQPAASAIAGEPDVVARLSLHQANALLLLRSHLTLDVDLRSLGITSEDEGLVVNPGNLLNLDFRITAPWGAHAKLRGDNGIPGQTYPGGLVWHLRPGQLNHVEAYFWMPSPLGLGSLAVIGLVAGGTWLKQRQLRQQASSSKPVA